MILVFLLVEREERNRHLQTLVLPSEEIFGSQELREEKSSLPKVLGNSICSHQKLGLVREKEKQEGVLVGFSSLRHLVAESRRSS